MDAKFWHQRWEKNEIGFHELEANPLLVKYFDHLPLSKGSRVFLPLCGKTPAIAWLLSKGCRVAGAELSEIAVGQLFQDLGVRPKIAATHEIRHYCSDGIDIFVGDIFNLTRTMLGPVDAIYDRAALVALPEGLRSRYAAHLMEIADHAPQLVIAYEYDQNLANGPPFSVSGDEVRRLYHTSYELILLTTAEVSGGLKGKCPAKENLWLLTCASRTGWKKPIS